MSTTETMTKTSSAAQLREKKKRSPTKTSATREKSKASGKGEEDGAQPEKENVKQKDGVKKSEESSAATTVAAKASAAKGKKTKEQDSGSAAAATGAATAASAKGSSISSSADSSTNEDDQDEEAVAAAEQDDTDVDDDDSDDEGEEQEVEREEFTSADNALGLCITLDNSADDEATVLSVSGQDQSGLLMQLTGALSALDLKVVAATVETTGDGQVLDMFRVKDPSGSKVPQSQWRTIRDQILDFAAASSRSGKPAIYGIAATAELQRIRPTQDGTALESDALSLEVAAAEMAQAAAALVSLERELARAGTSLKEEAMTALEAQRAEAASQLERKMAAMQAVLAARRSSAAAAAAVAEAVAPEPMQVGGPPPELAALMGPTPTSTGPASGNGYEILLQGFNWESCHAGDWYKIVLAEARVYAEAGFTAIWFPPPSDSVSPQGYLPRDLYVLDSKYGSEASLRECIAGLHELNFKVVADIVINHRCAHFQDDQGRWNVFGGRLAWDRAVVCSNNPQFGGAGTWKNQDDYSAAPNIDHSQERVREDLKKWLKWLRTSIGFDGWRFDYVKGYDGRWNKEYVDATVPLMAFGEYWDACDYTDGVLNYNQDSHRQRTVNWCDTTGGTNAAFDFTTKGILQEAVLRREYWRLVDPSGKAPGLVGMWPSRAITFIENHDTGSTLRHWPFPYQNTLEGYAYIITHPGTPCIFYDHFHDPKFNSPITKMLRTRKRNGVNARSKLTVRKAAAEVYAATVDDRVAMKIGPGDWAPSQSSGELAQRKWKLIVSGFQFAVWELENP